MLYGKMGFDFFSTSELLKTNMKIRLRLNRTRTSFYMISDNPNDSRGMLVLAKPQRYSYCSQGCLSRKRMDMLVYIRVEFDYLETLANTFIIPASKNQFIRWNIFNNAAVRRIAIAMNANSAFTGSYTENHFWYQQFDIRQIRKLKVGQPIVDCDAADNCRLYVTTMKTMNFRDDIPSIPFDNFKDH